MKSAKELLEQVKAIFNAPIIEAPAAPVVVAASKNYTTADGVEISIEQAGDAPAIGDKVSIAGAPAAEGTISLADGSSITVDAAGMITAVTPVEPATQPEDLSVPPVVAPGVAPVVPAQLAAQTPEELSTMLAAFATGTPEERIARLEIVAKALMESCMGYELREAERKASTEAAINIYKQGLTASSAKIEKQTTIINQMFELCEVLVKEPSTEPLTVPDSRKGKFGKSKERVEKFEGLAKAISDLKK